MTTVTTLDDLAGAPATTIATPAQKTCEYDQTFGRLQTITVNGNTFTINYLEGSVSQIPSITTGKVTTTFNPYGVNPSLLGGVSVSAGGNDVYSSLYHYNINNQIDTANVTAEDSGGNVTADSYAYTYGSGDSGSDAYSLTQVTDNGTVTNGYSYDGVGNFEGTSLGTANTLNQYSNLSYNGRGDVIDDGTYSYSYDANDRMVSVTPDNRASGQAKLTYGYDSQGRRLWKNVYAWNAASASWVLSYSRQYAYDGTQLVGELDGNGEVLTGYTWGPNGQLLAVTDYTQSTPKTYEAIIDASGNTAMLIDLSNGSVAASYRYDPYGNLISATGPVLAICSILGKGLYYDIEARSIGHALHRDDRNDIWYERDPAGEIAGGVNPYEPYDDDPINFSDRSGLGQEKGRRAGKGEASI